LARPWTWCALEIGPGAVLAGKVFGGCRAIAARRAARVASRRGLLAQRADGRDARRGRSCSGATNTGGECSGQLGPIQVDGRVASFCA
jgi:hypothetical protein